MLTRDNTNMPEKSEKTSNPRAPDTLLKPSTDLSDFPCSSAFFLISLFFSGLMVPCGTGMRSVALNLAAFGQRR